MAFWVVRAGKHGETEEYAFEHGVVGVGWGGLGDLSEIRGRDELQSRVSAKYPNERITTTRVWTGEIWALKERIRDGDLVALPLKSRAALAIGKVSGPYAFDASAPNLIRHQRPVTWLRVDLPRAEVDQDLLYSLGATLTVFQVRRNNAEERFLRLIGSTGSVRQELNDHDGIDQDDAPVDLTEVASDQISRFVGEKFKEHDLARLVEGILKAQGYQTLISPPGADGGVDIIAGTGPMGFDQPRLAVQVKSGESPSDVSVVRELQGVMPRFGADQGLVVSWGGFKSSVLREARHLYFKIRLWDAGALVVALQSNYQKLPSDLKAEIPLRQQWTLVLERAVEDNTS